MILIQKKQHKPYVGGNWVTFSFLLPVLVMFSIFVIIPIIQSIWLSFHRWNGFASKEWVGFENFINLFSDSRFLTSVRNNIYWLIFSFLAPVFGLMLALFLNQSIRGIKFIKSMFFFPFVINLVVVGLIFSWFYNPDFGLLGVFFKAVGLKPIPILADPTYATFGIILASLWPQTAYCLILFLTGLTNIRSDIVEAAKIDGAAKMSMFSNIILPQLRPATFIAIVVTVIGSLRSFDLIAIMTAGGPWGSSYVLAYHMVDEALFNFKMGYAAAIATFLFLIMDIYIVYFLIRLLKNEKNN